jgi:transposase
LRSQKLRMLLTHRKLLQSKAIAIENDLRGTLRNRAVESVMLAACQIDVRTIQAWLSSLPANARRPMSVSRILVRSAA